MMISKEHKDGLIELNQKQLSIAKKRLATDIAKGLVSNDEGKRLSEILTKQEKVPQGGSVKQKKVSKKPDKMRCKNCMKLHSPENCPENNTLTRKPIKSREVK